ncbi:MAG: lysozyme inhibitor LprI family protein [Desulfotalea sp.]
MRLILICAVLLSGVTTCFAASFDCTKAGTRIEKLICSDAEISMLDTELGKAYKQARKETSDLNQLKVEQRKWISKVRNKCPDSICLVETYKKRIPELMAYSSGYNKINLHGFTYNNNIINPKCVNLLQPDLSEKANDSIIMQTIIVDTCQESNLAFEGQEYEVTKDGAINYQDVPGDPYSAFSYRVIGRAKNGVFVLFHNGKVGLYRLFEEEIKFDFASTSSRVVKALSKLSETWVPCATNLSVKGNDIYITKNRYNPNAVGAGQCAGDVEVMKFNISGF